MFGIEDFTKPIVDFSNFEFSQLIDALLFGGAVLLIGMATIFSVLCILWLFLVIFRLVFNVLPTKKAEKKKQTATVNVSESVNDTKVADNDEIIAVIAAAVAMAESDNSGLKFRVVSFKRV